jgi:hypothetical protein
MLHKKKGTEVTLSFYFAFRRAKENVFLETRTSEIIGACLVADNKPIVNQ